MEVTKKSPPPVAPKPVKVTKQTLLDNKLSGIGESQFKLFYFNANVYVS